MTDPGDIVLNARQVAEAGLPKMLGAVRAQRQQLETLRPGVGGPSSMSVTKQIAGLQLVEMNLPALLDYARQLEGIAAGLGALKTPPDYSDELLSLRDVVASMTGLAGPRGETGAAGPRGDTGPAGAAGSLVARGTGSVTLSSLLGIGASVTVAVALSPTPPAGYVPQITVYGTGAGGAYVHSYKANSASVDVTVRSTSALAVGAVIQVNVQAT